MTPPAVVNAPVTRAHREEAARVYCAEATGDSVLVRWCAEWLDARERGVDLQIGRILTGKLDAFAQSLANIEAAVRREYSELEAAAAAWAKSERMAGVTDSRIQRALTELETLKDG